MRPEISEFSYGYALTESLLRNLSIPLSGAPVFPSLRREGRAGGGYDVALPFSGNLLFFQFKLSDCIMKNSVKEVSLGLLTTPFYRMYIAPMINSQQHPMLLDLEASGELVFYAAPKFHRCVELDQAYATGQVTQRSVFIAPSSIGILPDTNEHHVSFQNGPQGYFFSDTRLIENLVSGEIFLNLFKETQPNLYTKERLLTIILKMSKIISKYYSNFKTKDLYLPLHLSKLKNVDLIMIVQRIARVFFQCEIITIPFKEK